MSLRSIHVVMNGKISFFSSHGWTILHCVCVHTCMHIYAIIFDPFIHGWTRRLFPYPVVVQSPSCVQLFATPWTAVPRPPCPLPSPRVCPSSCSLDHWYNPAIPSSVTIFSCPQVFLASGTFPMNQLFPSGDQNAGASFSFSPPSEYSGLLSFKIDWFDFLTIQWTLGSLLQHRSLKASIFDALLPLQSSSHNGMWPLGRP